MKKLIFIKIFVIIINIFYLINKIYGTLFQSTKLFEEKKNKQIGMYF